ncbi:MAG: hypothetical protein MUC41_04310 [Syntrophobacteraceae bacterium]|nr:hypothetical protein [Syntrophobacteraceae bacterium]
MRSAEQLEGCGVIEACASQRMSVPASMKPGLTLEIRSGGLETQTKGKGRHP